MPSWFRRYLLPGFVFQSIILAGGYGTGRELVEFFLHYGPVGGLLGLLLPAMLLTSITCVLAFEVARVTGTYDYRSFFQQLLGPAWFLFEIGYLAAVLLIMAVILSATGTILGETFGIPSIVGAGALLAAMGFLVFKGSRTIENVLSTWSFVLYAVYIVFFVWSWVRFGPEIRTNLGSGETLEGWAVSGIRYGALQVSLVPAVLFATTHIRRRREAVVAGALVGPIAVIPALLFFVAMTGHYPEVLERPVPATFLLDALGSQPFELLFYLVLFGTLIETGTGLIHAFNERVDGVFRLHGQSMPPALRPTIAAGLLVSGALLSRFGIIALIARGYGTMTWFYMAIVVLPMLTVGVYRIRMAPAESGGRAEAA